MRSPGETPLITPVLPGESPKHTAASPHRAADLLHEARGRERAGCIPEAIACYESTIATAERGGEHTVLAEALRRLAIVRHHRDESAQARELCRRSYEVARQIGNDLLAAEALNTLGGLHLAGGSLEDARTMFLQTLELGGSSRELRARVEQNLGILANIQGELDEALLRYGRSLEAYRDSGDQHGCAIAFHNLGMVSADLGVFDEAEVDVARQRFENAKQNGEDALALFDQLGARGPKAGAYRVIGMVYRETGRLALAESRLRSAIELAVAAGSVLNEAEA